MKPMNFPARKLRRQFRAAQLAMAKNLGEYTPRELLKLTTVRKIRTKKDRRS